MGGKVSKLVLVARNNPDVYRTFLSNLRAGCSLASSCAAIGISPKCASVVLGRVKRGTNCRDTKKVARDIKTALGRVMGLTEAELRKQDPKFWLLHGPGRIITNEWNIQTEDDSKDKTASNTISSKDITDALIQLYKCGISIDQLIESGQISTLQIGAGNNNSISLPAPTSGEVARAGGGYGESSYGHKETNNKTSVSWEQKESTHSPTYIHNSPTTSPPNLHTNSPPKLFVSNEPVEMIDDVSPKKRVKITRTPKVPGIVDSELPTSQVHQDSSSLVSAGNGGVFSQESKVVESGQDAPLVDRNSNSSIEKVVHRNYDGPMIEKVSILKVDPTKVMDIPDPVVPEKKVVNNLPPTNADIAREQHHQKNVQMEEVLEALETLPTGLREFLLQKGIV